VIIGSGVFEGLEAVVTRVMPGPQRVAVLLDFLGRQTTLEVPTSELVRNNFDRVVKELKFAL
jgi:transcription antitermination factor NusG